jgi:hypothetical protein
LGDPLLSLTFGAGPTGKELFNKLEVIAFLKSRYVGLGRREMNFVEDEPPLRYYRPAFVFQSQLKFMALVPRSPWTPFGRGVTYDLASDFLD